MPTATTTCSRGTEPPTIGEWRLFRSTGLGLASWFRSDLLDTERHPGARHGPERRRAARRRLLLGGTWRYRTHAGVTPDLLSRVTDGYGNTVDGQLRATHRQRACTRRRLDAAFPEQEWQGPMTVVTEHTASDGIGGTYSVDHTYEGARQHRQGRGFEGFSPAHHVDDRNGVKTHEYFVRLFPHTGSPELTEVRQANNTLIESTDPVLSTARADRRNRESHAAFREHDHDEDLRRRSDVQRDAPHARS